MSATVPTVAVRESTPVSPVGPLPTPGELRPIIKSFVAEQRREGAGFIVRRPVGDRGRAPPEETDPFLMLDELGPKDYKKGEFPGAPWHPHRGFDTVMYIKQGQGSHEDTMGNKGTLFAGDCQWMTAGSGLEHNEGTDHPGGVLHGFQMWINLPAKHKMDPPAYQDVSGERIPIVQLRAGVRAKVIAGECAGVKAVVQTLIPAQYIDFMMEAGAEESAHVVPREMEQTMVYVYHGKGVVNGKNVQRGEIVMFGEQGDLKFKPEGSEGMSFLLMAGKKIREPIAWHGPFVMNTQQEIQNTIREYQQGKFIKHKGVYRRI